MIANEQEQTLRRLGLATGKQEDAQREGLAGKKSGLFYEAIRIIREMRVFFCPKSEIRNPKRDKP
jgi:hypothetical protein